MTFLMKNIFIECHRRNWRRHASMFQRDDAKKTRKNIICNSQYSSSKYRKRRPY